MLHQNISRKEAVRQSIELLNDMGIPDPKRRYKSYPHELSGGMRQRVMIAMALACRPRLLIADEPTTALSLIETKKVLDFISGIKKSGKSAIMISHTIYHLYPVSDRFVILDRGRIVGEFIKEEISFDELIEELQTVASTGHV